MPLSKNLERKQRQRLAAELRLERSLAKAEMKKLRLAIATSYSDRAFYKTPEWGKARNKALRRLGMRCGTCDRSGVPLRVEHIKPRLYYPELAFALDNLLAICEPCHSAHEPTPPGVQSPPKFILKRKNGA